jgi:hypothetical protein
MILALQLWKKLEEHRELSALSLAPLQTTEFQYYESPTMKAQLAWRVMVDMFDDDSMLMAVPVVLNVFNHFEVTFEGITKQ